MLLGLTHPLPYLNDQDPQNKYIKINLGTYIFFFSKLIRRKMVLRNNYCSNGF